MEIVSPFNLFRTQQAGNEMQYFSSKAVLLNAYVL
jgi:hypothetical protein